MATVNVESGVYFIQNLGTGTVMDLENGSSTNGTKVQGYQKRELSDPWVPAQLWVISKVGKDNVYTIENTNSRTFMDLTGSNVQNNTPIIGFEATGNPNQQWKIIRNSTGTAYVMQNMATGTFADLKDGQSLNGTAINGWSGSGPTTTNPHQLWLIVRA